MKSKKILILYSTDFEISEFKKVIESNIHSKRTASFMFEKIGVGQTLATSLSLKAIEKHKPDIILNIGIAGAFKQSYLKIGNVVLVKHDIIENAKDTGKDIEQYDFDKEKYLVRNKFLDEIKKLQLENLAKLEKVSSLTVSLVSSNIELADRRYKTFKTDIETMEGGAVSFVSNEFYPKIPFFQIRSISNFTGAMKMDKEDITLAVKKLNQFILALFQKDILAQKLEKESLIVRENSMNILKEFENIK